MQKPHIRRGRIAGGGVKLKSRKASLVDTSETVIAAVRREVTELEVDVICPLHGLSREERKREASKPLFLSRYE